MVVRTAVDCNPNARGSHGAAHSHRGENGVSDQQERRQGSKSVKSEMIAAEQKVAICAIFFQKSTFLGRGPELLNAPMVAACALGRRLGRADDSAP
jgi:hypothetical protein